MSVRRPDESPQPFSARGDDPIQALLHISRTLSALEPDRVGLREIKMLAEDIDARYRLGRHVSDHSWFIAMQRYGMHDLGCVASFSSACYPESFAKCTCPFKEQLDYAYALTRLTQIILDRAFSIFGDLDRPLLHPEATLKFDIEGNLEPLRQAMVLMRDIANSTIKPSIPEEGPGVIVPPPLTWQPHPEIEGKESSHA